MKLPSKSTPYHNSVLAVFPQMLSLLRDGAMGVSELRTALPDVDFGDFISALDCLFALGKIELDAERRVLHYVKTDTM